MKIKNRLRFIMFIVIAVLLFCSTIKHNKAEEQIRWVEYEVSEGEYYWHIARSLQQQGYKSRTDIRRVVDQLEEMSGIPAYELKAGDTILVPELR